VEDVRCTEAAGAKDATKVEAGQVARLEMPRGMRTRRRGMRG
jgi:hypothetical protein